MKKSVLFIASLLAIGAVCTAGCKDMQSGNIEKIKNYDKVQEEPDNNCEDKDCEDKNKPEFKFVQPENRGLLPRLPHKRHGEHTPAPIPIMPENPESD